MMMMVMTVMVVMKMGKAKAWSGDVDGGAGGRKVSWLMMSGDDDDVR